MPIDKERVEPAPFETAAPPRKSTETGDSGASGPSPWTLPVLVLLLVLALAVVFWLPRALEPDDTAPGSKPSAAEESGSADKTAAAGDSSGPAPAAGTPFADAEAARLRGEAQEILEQLLDLRETLTRRGADIWADDALAAVNGAANAGDELYRQREFDQAIESYQAALEQARAIESRIPDELEAQLAATEKALQASDAETARAALDLVDKLAPGLDRARQLRERLKALPEVVAQLETAKAAEEEDDLAAAKTALEAAVAADGEHRRARRELQRVSQALSARRFADAMSDGYAALDAQRFDDARAAFGRAGRLRAGSDEVAAALQEVSVAETANELRQLQRRAEKRVAEEDWSAAVSAYEAALEIDSSVLFAQRGLARARKRAELDTRLQTILDDADRLSDESVADATQTLLEYARRVEPRGPRLREQIRTLQKQLALANTPLPVTLLSDNRTEVVLLKVSRLGQFEREELKLRPGEYTAMGTRRGYRDVRETFRVSHDRRPPTVTIACTERI